MTTNEPINLPAGSWAMILESEKQTGCPAYLTAAQWILESGAGKENAAHNNGLGIKWFPGCPYGFSWAQTGEETRGGKPYIIRAKFVCFPSLMESFLYHGKLIMNPKGPYKAALPLVANPTAFIKKVGSIYGSDHVYADKVFEIIKDYKIPTSTFPIPSTGQH